jgi:hypothetical protein
MRTDAGSKLTSLEVHFTPEQEPRLATIAARGAVIRKN